MATSWHTSLQITFLMVSLQGCRQLLQNTGWISLSPFVQKKAAAPFGGSKFRRQLKGNTPLNGSPRGHSRLGGGRARTTPSAAGRAADNYSVSGFWSVKTFCWIYFLLWYSYVKTLSCNCCMITMVFLYWYCTISLSLYKCVCIVLVYYYDYWFMYTRTGSRYMGRVK